MSGQCRALVIAAAVMLAAAGASANSVVNGDFAAGLTGWNTATPPPGGYGNVSASGGVAVLAEDQVVATSLLLQQITIPAGAQSLSFEYTMTFTGTSGSGFPDTFAAKLLVPSTGPALLYTPGYQDYFSHEAGTSAMYYDPSIVSVSGGRVTLDLTSLALPLDAMVRFELIGSPDGLTSEATVDNVTVSQTPAVIPEPLTGICILLGLGAVGARLRSRATV